MGWNPISWIGLDKVNQAHGSGMTQERAQQSMPPAQRKTAVEASKAKPGGGGLPAWNPAQVTVTGSAENRAQIYGLSDAEASATFAVDKTGTRRRMVDEFDAFFRQQPAPVESLQRKLYASGFYGRVQPGSIKWGDPHDPYTVDALKASMTVAAQQLASETAPGRMGPYVVTTWQDVIDGHTGNGLSIAGIGAAGGSAGGAGYQGPVETTTTTLTTPGVAQDALHTAMRELLGRRPTDDEVAGFHKALNKAEKKHPQVRTDSSNVTGPEQDVTYKGGFNENDISAAAEENVFDKHGEEYAGVATDSLTAAFERLIFGS